MQGGLQSRPEKHVTLMCAPYLLVDVLTTLITLLPARLCRMLPRVCLFGRGCILCLVMVPPVSLDVLRVSSFMPICGGLHGRQSQHSTLPALPGLCEMPLSVTEGKSIVHLWVSAHSCQLSRAGLGGQGCSDICGHHCCGRQAPLSL